jgi:hypothetical protein
MPSERAWKRAKAHVAKGHEAEKQRLGIKGGRIGGGIGAGIGLIDILARRGLSAVPGFAMGSGVVIGHLLGRHVANKRLELSQSRRGHGHYSEREKVSSLVGETATAVRGQIQGTRRAFLHAKPVAHKPAVVATPQPQTPMIEPTTLTPNMSPAMKLGSVEGIRRARGRKKAEGQGGEPMTTWHGQKPGRWQRPGPENEVDFEFWRGHDF